MSSPEKIIVRGGRLIDADRHTAAPTDIHPADFAGLLIIFALLAMWIGILRHTGELDASRRPMSESGVPQ